MLLTLQHVSNVAPSSPWLSLSQRLVKAFSLGTAGLVITVALFVLMARLIEQDKVSVEKVQPVHLDPIIYQAEDETTVVRPKIKPIEQVIKTPPVQKVETNPEPNDTLNNVAMFTHVPNTNLDIKIGFNGAQGNMQASPQFRVDPTYPPEASRNGTEGWVKLGFTVSASGAVSDIEVLESQPARVFDRAAKRALKKWKYKPKLVDGKPVSQTGMIVVLDFKLEQ